MAEILIKGMEMPKGCNECIFHDGSWCHAQPIENWRDSYYRPPEGEKQPTCPLVEVPTHGDLIHYLSVKNAVIKVLGKDNVLWCDIMDEIDKLPVVIEAST